MSRKLTDYTTAAERSDLDILIKVGVSVSAYKAAMTRLGFSLGSIYPVSEHWPVLLVSTSEDADFLTKGFMDALTQRQIPFKLAVFWNNHYQINGDSVAPITQKYLQDGWQYSHSVVLLKSVISGSCVVRTNLLALLAEIDVAFLERILVAAPVMFTGGEARLKADFPSEIANKFEFLTFALDDERSPDGRVIPGIGGEIYGHLGLADQPARLPNGYMPDVVSRLVFS